MEDPSDSALLQAARHGDEQAFAALYRRHRDPVFRFAYRLSGSEAAGEDLAHDCFLGLLRAPERFDPGRASLRTYLFAAVRNLALKRLRRQPDLSLDDCPDVEVPGEASQKLISAEAAEAVRLAIGMLPSGQREALVLFEYEELTLEEIAGVLGIEANAVKARLHRARQALKKLLASHAGVVP